MWITQGVGKGYLNNKEDKNSKTGKYRERKRKQRFEEIEKYRSNKCRQKRNSEKGAIKRWLCCNEADCFSSVSMRHAL